MVARAAAARAINEEYELSLGKAKADLRALRLRLGRELLPIRECTPDVVWGWKLEQMGIHARRARAALRDARLERDGARTEPRHERPRGRSCEDDGRVETPEPIDLAVPSTAVDPGGVILPPELGIDWSAFDDEGGAEAVGARKHEGTQERWLGPQGDDGGLGGDAGVVSGACGPFTGPGRTESPACLGADATRAQRALGSDGAAARQTSAASSLPQQLTFDAIYEEAERYACGIAGDLTDEQRRAVRELTDHYRRGLERIASGDVRNLVFSLSSAAGASTGAPAVFSAR